MLETYRDAFHVSTEVAAAIDRMLHLLEAQIQDIGNASTTAKLMTQAIDALPQRSVMVRNTAQKLKANWLMCSKSVIADGPIGYKYIRISVQFCLSPYI